MHFQWIACSLRFYRCLFCIFDQVFCLLLKEMVWWIYWFCYCRMPGIMDGKWMRKLISTGRNFCIRRLVSRVWVLNFTLLNIMCVALQNYYKVTNWGLLGSSNCYQNHKRAFDNFVGFENFNCGWICYNFFNSRNKDDFLIENSLLWGFIFLLYLRTTTIKLHLEGRYLWLVWFLYIMNCCFEIHK